MCGILQLCPPRVAASSITTTSYPPEVHRTPAGTLAPSSATGATIRCRLGIYPTSRAPTQAAIDTSPYQVIHTGKLPPLPGHRHRASPWE